MAKHTFLIALLAAFPALAASPASNGIPLFFVANNGQTSPEVRFMAKGSGLTAYFLKDEAVFQTFGSSRLNPIEERNAAAAPALSATWTRMFPRSLYREALPPSASSAWRISETAVCESPSWWRKTPR